MIRKGRQTKTKPPQIVGNNLLDENIRKPDEITNTIMNNVIEFIETIDESFNFELFNYFNEESKNIILKLSGSIETSSAPTSLELTHCHGFIKNIYEANKNVFILPDKSNDINYMLMKCFLDANDIVHDAGKPNSRDISRNISYLQKLNEILNNLKSKSLLHLNCFTTINITGESDDRKNMLNEFIKNVGDDLELKVEKTFSLDEGYSCFLQEIYDNINLYSKENDKSSFTYRESGRELNIVEHYDKELNNDAEKNTFKKMFDSNNTLDTLFNEIINNKNDNTDNYSYINDIKKDAISAFDACGQTMNGEIDTKVQTFKNIYGIYDYHVKSFRIIEGKNSDNVICNKSIHFVIVTFSKSYINLLAPPIDNDELVRAIFLIQGEPSINFLVKKSQEILKSNTTIPRTGGTKRKGNIFSPDSSSTKEPKRQKKSKNKVADSTPYLITNKKWKCDEKDVDFPISSSSSSSSSSSIPNFENSKNEIINHVNKYINDIFTSSSSPSFNCNILFDSALLNGYYFKSNDDNEKQLLLYGNKTVGDLMFSCDNYKKQIYALSTTDSYVRASVFYNYLCGNNNICPSVWRQTAGGWLYTEGIFQKAPDKSAALICIKIASILTFIKYNDINLSNINENLKIFIKNAFGVDDENKFNEYMIDVEIERIKKCFENINTVKNNQENIMKAFYKLRTNNSVTINDILSYVLIYYEILNKPQIFNDYSKKLSEPISSTPSTTSTPTPSPNNVDIIKHIDSFSNLSNILYVNTISLYKNNKSTYILPKLNRIQSEENESNKMQIFNISPKLQKVIIKEDIKNDDDDTFTKKATINFICINNISNADETINFVYSSESKPVNQYLVNEGNDRYILENHDPCLKEIDIVDDGLYFKLIDDTLKHPILEIIIFSYQVIPTDKNLKLLGRYMRGHSTSRSHSPLYLHIYLLNLENIIGNLLKLLEYNSIKEDTNSSTLIISKIKKHYIDNLEKYAENNKEKCNEYIYEIIVNNIENITNVNDFSNIMVDNFIKSKINEIKLYNDIIDNISEGTVNNENKMILKKYNKIIHDEIYNSNGINLNDIKKLLTDYKNECCKDINEMCNLMINGININININIDKKNTLENENGNIESNIELLNLLKKNGLKNYSEDNVIQRKIIHEMKNVAKMNEIYDKAREEIKQRKSILKQHNNIITNNDIFVELIGIMIESLEKISKKNNELIVEYRTSYDLNYKKKDEYDNFYKMNCSQDDTSMEQVLPNNITGGSPPTMNDIIKKIIEKLEYFYNPNQENENLFVGPADEDDYLYYGEDDEVVDDDMSMEQVLTNVSTEKVLPYDEVVNDDMSMEQVSSNKLIKQSPGSQRQLPGSQRQLPGLRKQSNKRIKQLLGLRRQSPGSRRQLPGSRRQSDTQDTQYSQDSQYSQYSQDLFSDLSEGEEGNYQVRGGKRTKKRNIVGKKKNKKTKKRNIIRKQKNKNTRRKNNKRRNTKRRNK
jgi:hypothetical protein